MFRTTNDEGNRSMTDGIANSGLRLSGACGQGSNPAAAAMRETFVEFTFEAAHQTPPYSSLHGHSFRVTVYLQGLADPVYGWSHNLSDVERSISDVKRKVDHTYLNDIEGLRIPTLENVARWLWHELDAAIPGLDRVAVRRGSDGQAEGCVYARLRGPGVAEGGLHPVSGS